MRAGTSRPGDGAPWGLGEEQLLQDPRLLEGGPGRGRWAGDAQRSGLAPRRPGRTVLRIDDQQRAWQWIAAEALEAGPAALNLAADFYLEPGSRGHVWAVLLEQAPDGRQRKVHLVADPARAGEWQSLSGTLAAPVGRPWGPVKVAFQASPDFRGRLWSDELRCWQRRSARDQLVSPFLDLGADDALPLALHLSLGPSAGGRATLFWRSASLRDGSDASAWEALEPGTVRPRHARPARFGQFALVLERGPRGEGPAVQGLRLELGWGLQVRQGRVRQAGTTLAVVGARLRHATGATTSDAAGGFALPLPDPPGELVVDAEGYRTLRVSSPSPAGELDLELIPTLEWPAFRGGLLRRGHSVGRADLGAPPKVRWRLPLGQEQPWRYPAWWVDLDGDGRAELLTLQQGRAAASDGRGRTLWQSWGRRGPAEELAELLAVTDLDGDGGLELLFASGGGHFAYPRSTLVVLAAGSGEVLWQYEGFSTIWTDGDPPGRPRHDPYALSPDNVRVGDLDGDGRPEVVARAAFSERLLAFDFAAGVRAPRLRWESRFPGYSNASGPLVLGDLDADGRPEVIQKDRSRVWVFSGADGHLLAMRRFLAKGEALGGGLLVTDLDGDGRGELLLLHPAIGALAYRLPRGQAAGGARSLAAGSAAAAGEATELEELWSVSLPGLQRGASPVLDWDGDGRLEVLLGGPAGCELRRASDGSLLRRFPDAALRAATDLDGDGRPELLARSSAGLSAYSALRGDGPLWTIPGAELGLWDPYAWRPGMSPAAFPLGRDSAFDRGRRVFDLEGDGRAEILVAERGGCLHLFGVGQGAPVPRWRRCWPELERGLAFLGAADGDGDGRAELLLATPTGPFLVLDSEGALRFSRPGGYAVAYPLVADVDGRPGPELLIRGPERRYQLYDLGAAGPGQPPSLLPSALPRAQPPSASVPEGALLVDLDGDEVAELLLPSAEGPLAVYDGRGQERWRSAEAAAQVTVLRDPDGSRSVLVAEPRTHRFVTHGAAEGAVLREFLQPRQVNPPLALDLDGDGGDEVVDKDDKRHAYALDLRGARSLFASTTDGMCALGVPLALRSRTGAKDGGPAFAVTGGATATAWDRRGGLVWRLGVESEVFKGRHGAAGDLDGDGEDELVLVSPAGVVAAHALAAWAPGRPARPRWSFQVPEGPGLSDPVLVDLDGDTRLEVLFGANDGGLYALRGGDGALLWRVDLGAPVYHPVVADIDGDGALEILVAAGGELLALDR